MNLRVCYQGAPIRTIDALSSTLSCDSATLKRIALDTSACYIPFQVEKKSGGMREIRAPKPVLKTLQRRINSRIFSNCLFPAYLQGSIRDEECPRDFVSNARAHAKSKSIILADIRNFYPSVKIGFVFEIYKYLFRFSDDVSDILAKLTTLDGVLPQGAPTSSYIANLVFYDIEYKMVGEFLRANLIYTRLIDDITVSSASVLDKSKRDWIVNKISSMLAKKELMLHRGKLKQLVRGATGSQVVITGLNVDKGSPRLSATERRNVRAMVYNCQKAYAAGQATYSEFHDLHNSTSGKVALMNRLGHSEAVAYRNILGSIQPVYGESKEKKLARICWQFISLHGKGSERPSYARRYYKLMYELSVLGRSSPKHAHQLRKLIKKNPPLLRISDIKEE